jgi:hypothetical protein
VCFLEETILEKHLPRRPGFLEVSMAKKHQSKSARKDGRGGWVPGKRRHLDVGDWTRLRIDLAALLDDAYLRGVRTPNAVAVALGVSDRTVRRWLAGEDRPAPETQEAVRRWLAEQREIIKAERRRK